MKTEEIIQRVIEENPDVRTVLQIAAIARETEARDLPRDLSVAAEVVSIPNNPQCAV